MENLNVESNIPKAKKKIKWNIGEEKKNKEGEGSGEPTQDEEAKGKELDILSRRWKEEKGNNFLS